MAKLIDSSLAPHRYSWVQRPTLLGATVLSSPCSFCLVTKRPTDKGWSSSCDGQFCVFSWLGHATQIFGQTIVWLLPWRYFLDNINLYISRLRGKQITLHSVDGPHLISWRPYKKTDWERQGEEGILPPECLWTWVATSTPLWASSLPPTLQFWTCCLHSPVS